MPLTPAARMFVFAVLIAIGLTASAQIHTPDNRPHNCSISGRVTIAGQPAANVQVTMLEYPSANDGKTPQRNLAEMETYKATTDSDGMYRVTAMAAGRYRVAARMLAYVPANSSLNRGLARTVTLDEGEARTGVDFALVRGGVITGRVTNAEGSPLIGYSINLELVDDQRRPTRRAEAPLFGEMLETDDRGIYRIYGLPAGRYLLSVGDRRGFRITDSGSARYQRTYPPGTTNLQKARIIEVTEGRETTDADVQMGPSNKSYEVAGRMIDGDTGRPIPEMAVYAFSPNGEGGTGNTASDADGNFRITGLIPGKYQLQGAPTEPSESTDYFFERTTFEITESDVSGIEMKGMRGGAISGLVVVEGTNDPTIKAKLKTLYVLVEVIPQSPTAYSRSRAEIKEDGSFRARGLAPGLAKINAEAYAFPALKLQRIERNGADVKDGFEISKGELVTGVRLVFAYGSGTIRGEVKLAGGQLPDGWELNISAWRDGKQHDYARPDDKGRFALTNLLEGEYDVKLAAQSIRPNTQTQPVPFAPVTQRVAISKDGEIQVVLTANLVGKQEER